LVAAHGLPWRVALGGSLDQTHLRSHPVTRLLAMAPCVEQGEH